jgi:hypothetical protein
MAVDQNIIDSLASQILATSDSSKWQGEGKGSPQANAREMARILANAGITDIKQFGVKQEVIPAMYGEGLNEPERVVNKYYNKATGQELENTYGERQIGNFFGGTYTGKGNTGFGAVFDAQGNPQFFTSGASSSFLTKDTLLALGVMGGIGLLTSGIGAVGTEGLLGSATEAASVGATEIGGAGVSGMGAGTGLTAGGSGLGFSSTGGLGLTAAEGLTGTGVLSGSTLGTGLLGTETLAGLTGTGLLSGSELGTGLLGTTGTEALTNTGILSGSNLGVELLGTGTETAATVGGINGLNNVANVGLDAINTGITQPTITTIPPTTTPPTTTPPTTTPPTTTPPTTTPPITTPPTGLLTGLTAQQLAGLISGSLGTVGGLMQQQTSKEAAQAAQQRIDAETAAAKQAAQFRPVGMTTRFGTSNFTFNPTTGQMESAGYTLSPEAKAQQDRLMALANQGLTQAEQAPQQFAPLQTGAQSLFSLGNQYLAQSPEQVAQRYISQQMNLLQPGRELELANLQNRLQQQGRAGLAVAQGGNYGATTPELQALYNARAMQEAQLAANAQQAGQQQVSFGAGLLGQGAGALGQYYAGQQAAYAPYTTAMGQVQNLEAQGQQPLGLSSSFAQQQAQAGANAGRLGLSGAELSARLATSADATRNLAAQSLIAAGNPNAMFGQALGQWATGLFGGQQGTGVAGNPLAVGEYANPGYWT